jgi:hypothetical protein
VAALSVDSVCHQYLSIRLQTMLLHFWPQTVELYSTCRCEDVLTSVSKRQQLLVPRVTILQPEQKQQTGGGKVQTNVGRINNKKGDRIGNQTNDLPACSIAPQAITLPCMCAWHNRDYQLWEHCKGMSLIAVTVTASRKQNHVKYSTVPER